jgi:hypothetical protein
VSFAGLCRCFATSRDNSFCLDVHVCFSRDSILPCFKNKGTTINLSCLQIIHSACSRCFFMPGEIHFPFVSEVNVRSNLDQRRLSETYFKKEVRRSKLKGSSAICFSICLIKLADINLTVASLSRADTTLST